MATVQYHGHKVRPDRQRGGSRGPQAGAPGRAAASWGRGLAGKGVQGAGAGQNEAGRRQQQATEPCGGGAEQSKEESSSRGEHGQLAAGPLRTNPSGLGG